MQKSLQDSVQHPHPKGVWESLKVFMSGLLVGAAEIVPGISGGTVAFIIGIYEDLLHSISTLNVKAFSELVRLRIGAFFRQISWKFLALFLLGDIIALVSLAKVFTGLLNHEVWRIWLYSGFVGLVLGSCIYCYKVLKKIRVYDVLSFILGCVVAFLLSGANVKPNQSEKLFNVPIDEKLISNEIHRQIKEKNCSNYSEENREVLQVPASTVFAMIAKGQITKDTQIYDISSHSFINANDAFHGKFYIIDLWIVACGVIAVSAMLLPGISGSYILNVLGMYGVILGALVDWVHSLRSGFFEWDAFRVVLSMGLGISFGALVFARVVSWLLDHYHQITISCLIGFMVGALRAVWPFWTYSYSIDPLRISEGPKLIVQNPILPDIASTNFFIAFLAMVFGVVVVLVIESIADRMRSQ